MLGIDIYRYQTVTDPAAVARASVKYAWVKGTDGFGKAQAPADNQVRQMKAAGIPVGLYHYAQLGDPRRQAEIFIAEVNRLGAWGVMPALDLEAPHVPGAAARDFSIAFLQRMIELSVKRPVLYANTSMLNSIKPYQWNIPGLVIWAADYGSNNGTRNPDLRPYTGPVDVHQYTSVGRVSGIAGDTDLNWALTTRHLTLDTDVNLSDGMQKYIWPFTPANNEEFGAVVANTRSYAKGAEAKATESAQRITAVEAKVDAVIARLDQGQAVTLDYDLLADKVATRLAASQAAALADELAKRLEG